jgi:hypothetical protein
MATRILARHLQPTDEAVFCGKTQTVSAVNCDGDSVHIYVPGHPAEPYTFSRSGLVTVVTRDGQAWPGSADVPSA